MICYNLRLVFSPFQPSLVVFRNILWCIAERLFHHPSLPAQFVMAQISKPDVPGPISVQSKYRTYKGAVAHGVSRSINFPQYFLLLLHCVPLYVCRLCINFQELCARLLGMATLRIRFSPSFHALLIDFLSITKL